MNISILIHSFKYLQEFELIVSISNWIYKINSELYYSDLKLERSFDRLDYKVARSIIHFNVDKNKLDELLIPSFFSYKEDLIFRINLLTSHGANIHFNDDAMIRYCSTNNKFDAVMLIISKFGIFTHSNKLTERAIRYHNIETVKSLLRNGADIHFAIECAAFHNNIEITQLLINKLW